MPDKTIADIEALRVRYQELHTRQIRTQAMVEEAERKLSELRAQALQEFGTDSVEELTAKLQEMEAVNLSKRQEYERALDAIESKLAEIDREYRATE